MLDVHRYLVSLGKSKFTTTICPHCGAETRASSRNDAFCNFCEQYLNIADAEIQKEKGAENVFMQLHSWQADNSLDASVQAIQKLLQANNSPMTFYISALFYRQFSDSRYHDKNYALPGFMEANATNIRSSLDLTSKWKECLFKALKILNDDLAADPKLEDGFLFVKFMSEIRLNLHSEAAGTLKMLEQRASQLPYADYSRMVYGVETNQKNSEASLGALLARGEPNAFYYLAKHLAKEKKLAEASKILLQLDSKASILMTKDLLNKVMDAQDAASL